MLLNQLPFRKQTLTRTYKAQAVATMLGTTPDTIRRLTDESSLSVTRQENGPRTRIYSIENVYELANYRAQKKDAARPKKRVIATFYAPKGGIGKSTGAGNVGCLLPLFGRHPLLVDLDFQSNLTLSMGYDADLAHEEAEAEGLPLSRCVDHHLGSLFPQWPGGQQPLEAVLKKPYGEHGPHLIPSEVSLDDLDTIMAFEALQGRNSAMMIPKLINDGLTGKNPNCDLTPYDFILFDAPPAKSRITKSALLASDYVIAPVGLEKFSTKAVSYLSKVLREMKDEFGRCPELIILGNFFNVNSPRVLSQTAKISERYPNAWLSAVIRRSEDFPKALSIDDYETDMPLALSMPNSPGADDMRNVTKALLTRMGALAV